MTAIATNHSKKKIVSLPPDNEPPRMSKPFSDIREIASLSGSEYEQACRDHTFYAYLGNNTGLCKVLTKYKIYVDTRDAGVTPHYIMDGFWESWLTQCLARIVNPGDVCIDAGANFGYFSLLMSELCGKEGKTVAIDPNPNMCRLLRLTQAMHGWRFKVVEAALADKEGITQLSIPESYYGGASLNEIDASFRIESKIDVRTMTVDTLVKELGLPKVNVMKIDVEGLEERVFEGMKETIANNEDLKIIIEFTPVTYKNPEKFTQYLYDNFVVYRIKDVHEPKLLDEADMKDMLNELLRSGDHTDIYLVKDGSRAGL